MREFLTEVGRRIAALILAHFAVAYVLAAGPIAIGIASALFVPLPLYGTFLVAFLGVGWGISVVAASLWYWNQYGRRMARMQALATAMYRSDLVLPHLIQDDAQRHSLYAELNALLKSFCEVLSYRHALEDKAAAFFLVDDHGMLQPRAQFNHDNPHWSQEVGRYLLARSLAGAALQFEAIRMEPDSWHPGRHSDWAPGDRSDFRGRAAAPVKVLASGGRRVIGVLCFDSKKSGLLSEEDQGLLALFADKLGALWHFCHGIQPAMAALDEPHATKETRHG